MTEAVECDERDDDGRGDPERRRSQIVSGGVGAGHGHLGAEERRGQLRDADQVPAGVEVTEQDGGLVPGAGGAE